MENLLHIHKQLFDGRRIRQIKTIVAHCIKDLVAKDASQISLVDGAVHRRISNQKMIALETDFVDVGVCQICGCIDGILRILRIIAATTTRKQVRAVFDDLLCGHFKLRPTHDKVVHFVAKYSQRQLWVATGQYF